MNGDERDNKTRMRERDDVVPLLPLLGHESLFVRLKSEQMEERQPRNDDDDDGKKILGMICSLFSLFASLVSRSCLLQSSTR